MDLIQSKLFLGFLVDQDFSLALSQHSQEYLSLFINEEGPYLQSKALADKSYLGKIVNNESPLSELDLIETNIYSILKKLVPNYPYQESSLVLFAIPLIIN